MTEFISAVWLLQCIENINICRAANVRHCKCGWFWSRAWVRCLRRGRQTLVGIRQSPSCQMVYVNLNAQDMASPNIVCIKNIFHSKQCDVWFWAGLKCGSHPLSVGDLAGLHEFSDINNIRYDSLEAGEDNWDCLLLLQVLLGKLVHRGSLDLLVHQGILELQDLQEIWDLEVCFLAHTFTLTWLFVINWFNYNSIR